MTKHAWYTPSLWEAPIRVTIIQEETRKDGRPIYTHSVSDTGELIMDYSQKFSRTKPVRYH